MGTVTTLPPPTSSVRECDGVAHSDAPPAGRRFEWESRDRTVADKSRGCRNVGDTMMKNDEFGETYLTTTVSSLTENSGKKRRSHSLESVSLNLLSYQILERLN